jgi:hypothetical protein
MGRLASRCACRPQEYSDLSSLRWNCCLGGADTGPREVTEEGPRRPNPSLFGRKRARSDLTDTRPYPGVHSE